MGVMSYLVGRPIYRGASNAPTRGTVDPMGYINRSLASPVGGDGLSDKRSGLAQAALMRMRQFGMHHRHSPMPLLPPQSMAPYASAQHMGSAMPMLPPMPPQNLGYTVSPTGQLLPQNGRPYDTTAQSLNGAPQQAETVSEGQLMAAARERLSHQLQTKEMMMKHQHAVQQMNMRAAEAINKHRKAVRLV